MNLEQEILNILKEKKSAKAKVISEILGVSTTQINSQLHGKLKSLVIQDNKYNWSLREALIETSELKQKESLVSVKNHSLARLSRYYLECLSKDIGQGIEEFASNFSGRPKYCQLGGVPSLTDSFSINSQNLQSYVNAFRANKSNLAVCIGYPIVLTAQTAASTGKPYYKVKPLLLQKLDEEYFINSEIVLSNENPYLNPDAISYLEGLKPMEMLSEMLELNEELGLNEIDAANLEEVTLRLRSMRESWDWKEDSNIQAISSVDLSIETVGGIYNACAVFMTEKSKYTVGLEKELDDLQRLDESDYSETILGKLIKYNYTNSSVNEKVLVEPLPMNEEQREAILRGLQRDLTVVTGPPGTGKSQVVTNLVVNAVKDGQRVLFASKNNKAVDVVLERVNGLSNHPVMLRLGNTQKQSDLTKFLTGLISARVSDSVHSRYREAENIHETLRSRINELISKQNRIINLRNEVDVLEQGIEVLRNRYSSEVFKKIREADDLKLDELRISIDRWRVFYNKNSKKNSSLIGRILWPFNSKNRNKKAILEFELINRLFEKYGLESIEIQHIVDFDYSVNIVNERIEELLIDVYKITTYGKKLFELSNGENLYELSLQEIELKQSISENSLRFWQLWLELLPNRLDTAERKLIGDYITVLDLIVKSDEEKRFVNKGVWVKYYKLLPEITNILSCWAVTSLSVRSKVPFEPSFFDVVIIDEASQCDIASAVPLLYRAKRAVIIGDDKQLTHISTIPIQEDNQLLEKHNLIDDFLVWSYASSSLFRLAASLCDKMDIVQLKDHHRSHADIINYSNKYFYDGSLRVATNYDRLNRIPGESAVRWIDVKGAVEKPVSGGAVNKKEVNEVVNELKRLVETGYEGTIGVVTPFRGHANMIRDKVYTDQILYLQLINRDFIVDTVHKFQGDERDVMIFSSVISVGMKAGTESFLSRNGNLFNVALTRARAALIVIGDMNACISSSVTHFSQFAKYVQSLESSKPIKSDFSVSYSAKYPKVGEKDVVSNWEKILYERLFAEGIFTMPQYKIDKYSLDLALVIGDRRLDIEIDGETYHRGWDGELLRRDKIRNSRLIELGWDVQRFWVYEIRDDIESCVKRIQNWIDK